MNCTVRTMWKRVLAYIAAMFFLLGLIGVIFWLFPHPPPVSFPIDSDLNIDSPHSASCIDNDFLPFRWNEQVERMRECLAQIADQRDALQDSLVSVREQNLSWYEVDLVYRQTWVLLLGFSLSALTVIAATVAVYFNYQTVRNGTLQSRAWVAVEIIGGVARDENGLPNINVSLKNLGTTPALNVRYDYIITTTQFRSDEDEFFRKGKTLKASLATIAPSQEINIKAVGARPADDYRDVWRLDDPYVLLSCIVLVKYDTVFIGFGTKETIVTRSFEGGHSVDGEDEKTGVTKGWHPSSTTMT